MWKSVILLLFVLCVVAKSVLCVQALEISSKMGFVRDESSKSKIFSGPVEVFHPTAEAAKSAEKLSNYQKTVIVKPDDTIEKVICKDGMCIVTVDADITNKKPKTNTVQTDVHVIVSSDVNVENEEGKKTDDEDDERDVPIFKGYNGVSYTDVNWKDSSDETVKPRSENEVPSSIITSPYNGEEIIINPNQPADRVIPPKDNWNGQYWNNNDNRGERIPSGWSSNWKPSYPPPQDHYHYNGNGDRVDFAGYKPTYRNVCKCVREPVYPDRSDFYPQRPSNPWYPPETTTKQIVDDKLSPPFSNKEKRNNY